MKKFFKEHKILFLLLTFLFVIFLATYPAGYLAIDEHDYVENSKLFWKGNLQQQCDPENISQIDIGPFCIYKYNIGASIFMLPINIFGEPVLYLIAYIAFLASVVVFYRILAKLKLPKDLVVFYALFPAIAYYGRTAYSEIYSILLSLLFFYFYIRTKRKSNIWAGSIMGLSLLVRPTNLFFYGAYIFFEHLFNGKLKLTKWPDILNLILELLIGFTPFLIIFLLFNNYLYLDPLKSGYSYSGDLYSFDLKLIPTNLFNYFILLNLFYPGMLILVFFSKSKHKWPIMLSFLLLLVFYSATSNNNWKSDINLIIGIRFLMPAIPLLILLYVDVIKDHIQGYLFTIVTLLLALIMILMQFVHASYLNENADNWLENHKRGMQENELSWY